MALPDYIEKTQGTAIVWGPSGGAGVTANMSLDALANGAAQQGESVDLGANWAQEWVVVLRVETGTAPTASNTVDCYLAFSSNNTNWPGKVSGSDGSYTLGTSDANLRQLGPPVASLIATADANTVLEQAGVIFRPTGRYVAPVYDNNLGVAFRDEATASDNGSRIIIYPLRDVIND